MHDRGMEKKLTKAPDQSGAIVVIMGVALIMFCGFLALVIDVGHMVLVKGELQRAADAGAIAGAQALPDWSQGQTKATQIVELSKVEGQLLTSCQVQPGYWSTTNNILQPTSITPQATDIAAIQVTVAKTADQNGGPVQMYFAPLIGAASTRDLSATAVAIGKPGGKWSILETGAGKVTISGAVIIYGSVGVNGSNGNLTMTGSATVQSPDKAYLNTGATKSIGSSCTVKIQQDGSANSTLSKAAASAQTANTNFRALSRTVGPASINLTGIQTLSITGNNTVNVLDLTTFSLSHSGIVTLSAPPGGSFVIKVSGTFSVKGAASVVLAGGLTPDNVTFVNTGTGTVTVANGAIIRGNILSLNGAINLQGDADYFGTVIGGKAITLANSVHSPDKLPWLTGPGGQGSALVN